MFYRTLACLPALTGAWRDRGGGLARSVGSWSEVNVDDTVFDARHLAGGRERRAVSMNHLGRALTTLDDPRVMALVVWNGNPLVTVPNAALTRQGLERDDLFCVVSEQFVTDTARYADVVFPAATQIEQMDVVPAWGHLYLGWNEAAIAPLGESVPNTELWRRLAGAMGYTEPELVRVRRVPAGVGAARRRRGRSASPRRGATGPARRPAALRRRWLPDGQREGRAVERRAGPRRPPRPPHVRAGPRGPRRRCRPAGPVPARPPHPEAAHPLPQLVVLAPAQARPARGHAVRRDGRGRRLRPPHRRG